MRPSIAELLRQRAQSLDSKGRTDVQLCLGADHRPDLSVPIRPGVGDIDARLPRVPLHVVDCHPLDTGRDTLRDVHVLQRVVDDSVAVDQYPGASVLVRTQGNQSYRILGVSVFLEFDSEILAFVSEVPGKRVILPEANPGLVVTQSDMARCSFFRGLDLIYQILRKVAP